MVCKSNHKQHATHFHGGFTLIEVLVVVSILALLIAMLLPAIGYAREQARRSVCMSNLGQMGAAMTSHTTDNDGLLPGPSWYGQTARYTSGTKNLARWLAPYMGYPPASGTAHVNTMFICPSISRVAPPGFSFDQLVIYGALSEPNPTTGKRVFGYPHFNKSDGTVIEEYGPSKMGIILSPSSAKAVRDIDYPASSTAGWWEKTALIPIHGYEGETARRNYLYFDAHVEGLSEHQEYVFRP